MEFLVENKFREFGRGRNNHPLPDDTCIASSMGRIVALGVLWTSYLIDTARGLVSHDIQ